MGMLKIRDYAGADAGHVNALGVAAFEEYRDAYSDWPASRENIAAMSSLSDIGQIVVAQLDEAIVGAVAYIGPHKPKSAMFQSEWPIMRMLVVAPDAQGKGVGRALTDECIRRTRRDGAAVFALHTSELMRVALPMYERMGFRRWGDAPTLHGVKYGVYVLQLDGPT